MHKPSDASTNPEKLFNLSDALTRERSWNDSREELAEGEGLAYFSGPKMTSCE